MNKHTIAFLAVAMALGSSTVIAAESSTNNGMANQAASAGAQADGARQNLPPESTDNGTINNAGSSALQPDNGTRTGTGMGSGVNSGMGIGSGMGTNSTTNSTGTGMLGTGTGTMSSGSGMTGSGMTGSDMGGMKSDSTMTMDNKAKTHHNRHHYKEKTMK